MKKYKVTIEREFEVEIDDEKLLKNSPKRDVGSLRN